MSLEFIRGKEIGTAPGSPKLLGREEGHKRLVEAAVQSIWSGQPLACLLIDLDGFDWVYREHGWGEGDRLLAEIGHLLAGGIRGSDRLARLDGAQFLLIAPDARAAAAAGVGRRLAGGPPERGVG